MAQASDVPATDDVDLVERFRNGDQRAFEEIVARYSSKVMSICHYYMRDRDNAYDVSQEVFLRIFRGLPEFRGDCKLSTWIHTVTLNTCRNWVDWFKRLIVGREEITEHMVIPANTPDPGDVAVSNEQDKIIREEITKLSPRFREIVVLKDIEDKSYEEIAQILAINLGTVKSRLHRARAALVERLTARKAIG